MDTSKGCSINGCERPHRARGWCIKHYKRWHRLGSPEDPSDETRFWSKVSKGQGCWLWIAGKSPLGYGVFSFTRDGKTRNVGAHRYSYELTKGAIAEGLDIDHMCHNPMCVNPDHLRAATRKQNSENRKGAQINNRLGVRGVEQISSGRYRVAIGHGGRKYHLGVFGDLEEAERVSQAARDALFTIPKKITA